MFEVLVFDSQFNNSYCETLSGDTLEEGVDYLVNHSDWLPEIECVKHTHSNVLEFHHSDGTITYKVFSPIWDEDHSKPYKARYHKS